MLYNLLMNKVCAHHSAKDKHIMLGGLMQSGVIIKAFYRMFSCIRPVPSSKMISLGQSVKKFFPKWPIKNK